MCFSPPFAAARLLSRPAQHSANFFRRYPLQHGSIPPHMHDAAGLPVAGLGPIALASGGGLE